jgi:hypothetical protein
MDRYALALVWKMIVGLWELDMSMGEARGTNILINVWLNVVSLTLKRHKFTKVKTTSQRGLRTLLSQI